MNTLTLLAIVSAFIAGGSAFSAPTKLSIKQLSMTSIIRTQLNGYVPDGLTKEQYKQIKINDAKKIKGKNLGALGTRGFESRSLTGWQKALQKGQAKHVFAPVGYREQLKKGLMKKEDVPYMVRGGSWDKSDIFGAFRLPWNKKDVEYARGGYKKEQSASLLGSGPGLDWTGKRPKSDKDKKSVPGFS
jgi:hypothetical protein